MTREQQPERLNRIIEGDALDVLDELPSDSVDCIVTSPPYWGLRDYDVDGQIGLESHVSDYIDKMVDVGAKLKRVLKPSGGLHLNLGDTYNTNSIVRARADELKMQSGDDGYEEYHTIEGREKSGRTRRSPIPEISKKSKLFVPHRVAIALTEQGWIAKNDIPWIKPRGGQDSATDRYRCRHEYFFYFVLSDDNYWNPPKSSVYDVIEETTASCGDHAAAYPPRLVEPAIEYTCPPGGVVLDPFAGSGTTCVAATRLDRDYIGIELNPEYAEMARKRVEQSKSTRLTAWGNA